MKIGEQIKKRRQELNMTQEDLAQKLNVARSTISNWEIGRNYPDIQLIVSISDALDLSLDTLLREESDIVQEIANDTRIRKSQTRKIRVLKVLILLCWLVCILGVYKGLEYQDLSSPEQIVSVKTSEGKLEIVTDLPFYRSLSGDYMAGNAAEASDTIELSLVTRIDLSMKNEETIQIDIRDLGNGAELKKVNIVDGKGVVKTVYLQRVHTVDKNLLIA